MKTSRKNNNIEDRMYKIEDRRYNIQNRNLGNRK